MADKTERYTEADITAFISAAIMLAIREYTAKYEDPKEAEKHLQELEVYLYHIEKAMKIKPLSTQELEWYKQLAERLSKPRPSSEIRGGIL